MKFVATDLSGFLSLVVVASLVICLLRRKMIGAVRAGCLFFLSAKEKGMCASGPNERQSRIV